MGTSPITKAVNPMVRLLSIQVGMPAEHGTEDAENPLQRPWESSIFKYPVAGTVQVSKFNIAGDAQTDLVNHGGVDKAILAYAAGHYAYWRDNLPEIGWTHGGFGENLTIDGLTEDTVCLGDVYRIGPVLLEVSQPRFPCWKLARRWLQKDLTARVERTGFTGWYHRVLAEGHIEAGLPVEREARPYPDWTMRRTTDVIGNVRGDAGAAAALAECPALAAGLRQHIHKKLAD